MANPVYEIEIYRLDVEDDQFARIDVITTYKNLKFFNKLNGIGQCTFELDIFDPKATRANLTRFRNQIVIKRNGDIKWFGPIVNITGNFIGVDGKIVIQAETYLAHFKTRVTDQLKQFTDTDRSEVVSTLISESQARTNGNLKVQEGTLETSVDTSETYEYGVISDLIIEQSTPFNGIDFDFQPVVDADNKLDYVVINTYFPRQANVRDDLPPLQIGSNVRGLTFKLAESLYNSGTGLGAGTGDGVTISTIDYGNSQKAYTRKEIVQSLKDVSVPEVLSALLDRFISLHSVERQLWNVDFYPEIAPTFADLSLGDILIINIKLEGGSDLFTYKGQLRVAELAVDIDNQGVETTTPLLEFVS